MNIQDAVRALERGERVGRGYSTANYTIHFELKIDECGYLCTEYVGGSTSLPLDPADILAEDWQIIPEEEEE